jgi:hypothetical protein
MLKGSKKYRDKMILPTASINTENTEFHECNENQGIKPQDDYERLYELEKYMVPLGNELLKKLQEKYGTIEK